MPSPDHAMRAPTGAVVLESLSFGILAFYDCPHSMASQLPASASWLVDWSANSEGSASVPPRLSAAGSVGLLTIS